LISEHLEPLSAFPPVPEQKSIAARSRTALAAVVSLALLVKLLIAWKTYGTNDVYVYDEFSVWTRYLGVALYRLDSQFNHPPSMIHLLHFLSWLAVRTGLPFSFWLRLPGILADAGNVWIVWKLLGDRIQEQSIFWSLILFAGAPTLILISGFHGNTDSVVIFFVLLSIYLVETGASDWAAGAAFGLAHCVKVFPVIVAPVILLNLRGPGEPVGVPPSQAALCWRKIVKFSVAAGAVLLAGWSPFLFQDPQAVIGQVFGYRSLYGHWGLTYLALQLPPSVWADSLNAFLERFGTYLALGLVWFASWRMNRASPQPRLFSQAGLVFLLFLSVSSGFGVQYLAWLAPWVVELGWAPAAIFYAASGVFLFLVYNYWAQGLPWYLADAINVGDYPGYFAHAQLICWFSVLLALMVSWGRIGIAAGWKRTLPFPPLAPGWRIAGGLLAACALFAVVPAQPSTPPPPGGKDARAVRAIMTASNLDLAESLAVDRRYEDSIRAAREALELTPDSAAAYADIASAYAALGRWEEAGENAERALSLNPDFPAARNVRALAASKK
jgi:tetratricopeptide (TPR) repeat protein